MGTSKGYLPPTGNLWSDSKRDVSMMIRNNFSSSSIGKAISSYAKANNSTESTKKADSVISKSGTKILRFAGLVGSVGLNGALSQVGLSNLIGKEPQRIFEGLIDFFSEGTNSIQEVIANQAMQEYMEDLAGSVDSNEELEVVLSELESDLFIRDYLIKYIQSSFFSNFAEKIMSKMEDMNKVVQTQKRINDYISIEVTEEYKSERLINLDWKGREGKEYIDKKCREVCNIFEGWIQ